MVREAANIVYTGHPAPEPASQQNSRVFQAKGKIALPSSWTIIKDDVMNHTRRRLRAVSTVCLLTCALLAGCPERKLVTFDPDGELQAEIRRTAFGVPHIRADNLESLGFGVGYAFAQDNACVLADIIMRYNSERARHLGPDQVPGSGDAQHLISDFGFLALEVRQQAENMINDISDRQRALLSGYTKGYNRYLEDTGIDSIDPTCAGKPWVRPIDETDLLTALLSIALLPGSMNFLAPMFIAAPPGEDFQPVPAPAALTQKAVPPLPIAMAKVQLPQTNLQDLGSNAWALGSRMTRNGRGMLLANPHFPHTGQLRFWQFHTTIPGVLDVMGASITGTPGIVNIGFNHHLAWTHTFSTAEHFIVYQLALQAEDSSGLTYTFDGEPRKIYKKTKTLPVAIAPDQVMMFQKDFYYSDFGPMIKVPDKLGWGNDPAFGFSAFSLKDVNKANPDIVDHWLAMNLARNLDEFKQTFKHYNGVIFNNTLVADAQGKVFYIDDSTVPHLSTAAEKALRADPRLRQLREQAGFTILPGHSSEFDFSGPVPHRQAPQLQRRDFVQNSNDSYWLTHPRHPITDVSILYGQTHNPQSLRSRLAQKMLRDSAGRDGRYSLTELENVLFNFRNYLGEAVLDDLLTLCQSRGDEPVALEKTSVNIAAGCVALAQWDGRFDSASRAAHLFREFANEFAKSPQWQVPFDPGHPLTTPNTLSTNDNTLKQFAQAILNVEAAGVALNTPLGEVQFVQRLDANGEPGERLPWPGNHNLEGGFNVFRPVYGEDGSQLPRTRFKPVPGSQISADGQGYPVDFGSSWMMVVGFDRKGPRARGLMTYSQSIDPTSAHQLDQTRKYSERPRLFPLPFHERDVARQTESVLRVSMKK